MNNGYVSASGVYKGVVMAAAGADYKATIFRLDSLALPQRFSHCRHFTRGRATSKLAVLAARDERRQLHTMSCSLKNTDTGSHIADISRAVARLQNQLPWLHAMSNGGFTR
ncbi:hypothetical protein NDU88_008795 [Pleurodeles waltl]|uniref:Uncharacterized protein n=1 Tax=Pleurodeles waltl TaxID=8319 RepID=A0AAV7PT55_PLEWA|nr:hypothetical protein NDU88_008795 [Pleurodeles waltl]